MAMLKKKAKVVMLPTEKAENCIAMYFNGKISWSNQLLTKSYRESAGVKVFQLFIILDEEIKEGDWCVDITTNTYLQVAGVSLSISDYESEKMIISKHTLPHHYYVSCKKVIATTNTSLSNIGKCNQCGAEQLLDYTICNYNGICKGKVVPLVSQPSPQFVEKYIKAYNSGNPIVDVMVEYYFTCETGYDKPLCPKVDGNNFISITKCKDIWLRGEVADLIRKAYFEATGKSTGHPDGFCNKFIEENL